MNRPVIAATVAGIAAAASVGTAIALPSRPSTRSGAFTFVAVQTLSHHFANGHAVGSDKELSAGHLIGTDSLACVPSGKTTATCDVAASYKGGQLFGNFTENVNNGSLSGKVTGGTRLYKGAVGTIKGSAISATKEKVSITYQTP